MAVEWKGKVLLITGASKGIGAKVIRFALDEGVERVVNLDVDVENGAALESELNGKYGADKVKFIKCDVTDEAFLRKNFEAVLGDKSGHYVVINNAGILNDSLKLYKKQIEINVTALITGTLIALELLRKENGGNGGTVINISSVAALCPLPFTPIYNATKAAVLSFSTAIGSEEYYQRSQVRVLTICFGVTDTGLVAVSNMGSFDEVVNNKMDEPLKKYPSQSVDSGARSVIEMFKKGASGSVWLSNANKPVEDVSDAVKKGYEIMSAPLFD